MSRLPVAWIALLLASAAAGPALAAPAPATEAPRGARSTSVLDGPAKELPAAEPLGLTAKVEPSTVELGRPFVYEIEIRHEPSERYELPKPLALGTAAVGKVETSRTEADGVATTTFRVEATIYDQLGEAALPDLVLPVRGGEGEKELRIPGAPVTIEVSTQGDELADVRPPQELVVRSYTALWILLLFCAAALLGWLVSRRLAAQEAGREDPKLPKISAKERALTALRELQGEALPTKGKGREHYFRLSEIVRAYLEGDAGILALDMTSGELLAALEAKPVPGLSLPDFRSWMERGDFVRFAQAAIDPELAMADLEQARGLVQGIAAALRAEEERAAAAARAPKEGAA